MPTIIILAVIGLFCYFVMPAMYKGRGKKLAARRRNWRIAGAVCWLLTAIGIIGYVF